MTIEFDIKNIDQKEQQIIPQFCEELTKSIIHDIKYNIRKSKLQSREKDLLNSTFINWIYKPELLEMYSVGILIANSIRCYNIGKNLYCIQIDRSVKFPNSRTKLSRVARFLDKGNENTPPTWFITSVFNKYRRNINKYWKSFVAIRLKRIETSEVVSIR